MDIHAGVIALAAFAVIAAYFCVRTGLRIIRASRKLTFHSLRRQRGAEGWRLLIAAAALVIAAVWLPTGGEEIAYRYYPPSPTAIPTPTTTQTPTITLTPTITMTPTTTETPSVTDTVTATASPSLPLAIEAIFTSVVTPNPEAAFSPIEFSTVYDGVFAVDPQTVFQNPVGHMYGAFSYDGMLPGVQWTELWLRDGALVHFETKPWDGVTGGYGYADWNPPLHEWLPGTYQVQLFVGLDWRVVGEFVVSGAPPTPPVTITLTPTTRPTASRTATAEPTAYSTTTSTATRMPATLASP